MMSKTMDTITLFSEIKKLLDQIRSPGVEVAKLIEMRQHDINGMIEATRVLLDGAQSLTDKQVTLLRGAVDELSGVLNRITKPGQIGVGAKVSPEFLQQTVHASLQSISELVEIATTAQVNAIDIVAKRIHTNVEYWTQFLRQK
jgi:phasin family protein